MSEIKQYNIDFEKIKISFKFKENGLTHSQGSKFKLLPYAANEKSLVSNFNGVIGSFSRILNNKKLKGEFKPDEFIENVADEIGDFDRQNSRELLKDLVKSMFIDDENLVDFDIKTINYITSTTSDDKVAKFLYSIFFNDELKSLAIQKYDKKVENILYRLVLNALPELTDTNYEIEEYKCYLPFIKELFIKDFKFVIKNEDLYKSSLKRVLEYYYMFYVSQLAMKLSKFEKADISKPDVIYYTLNWESTSKNRTCYKFGWESLKSNVNSLFSHAIVLEFLNHHEIEEQLGYIELFNLFNLADENEISSQIEVLYEEYKNHITDKNWDELKFTNRDSGNKAFDGVYRLFEAVEFQFNKSSRTRAYDAYKNWFVRFVYENFSKKRGALGYNLNMTEEDIILMTKVCINDNNKLKLNSLFHEFEKRGLFFDRDSKIKIAQLYEKLNLLEKKSDSGDAQYVRSVL